MRHIGGILLGVLPAVLLASPVVAQPSINYPTFSFNGPFQNNGSAQGVNGGALLLTYDANQAGSTYVIAPQDVTQSFVANYSFYMGSGFHNNVVTSGTGPGGIVLVIGNDSRGTTALGGGANQLGFGDGVAMSGAAIQHTLALTYSTFGGLDQFELMDNTTNGNYDVTSVPIATQSGSENLNGLMSQVTLNYESPDINFANGAISVLLNGNNIGMNNIPLPASLATIANGSNAEFGFTASAGGTPGTGPSISVRSLVATGVPEPGTMAVLGLSAVGLLARRRRVG
jgi:hypothetical protein